VRLSARTAALFTLLLAVMTFHEAEHVVQIWQKDVASASCPNDCRGLLGFAFDLEWIHFAYNGSILLALGALVGFCGLWRNLPLAGAVALQSYHMYEHVEKLTQWFANGGHSPTPGLLGMHVSLVELHFAFNTGVYVLVLTGYFTVGAHRTLWQARTPARIAVAATLLVVSTAGTAAAWTQRPPTVRLAAGVHDGPIILDRAQRLVGEPGAVVRGGIVVAADDVVVRDLSVLGGETGIEVRDAENVLLEDVAVAGAALDGIAARRSSVIIRRCSVDVASARGQGIDISFAHALPPSLVTGCRVRGGREGIVTNLANVRLAKNRVSDTRLRAISVTEMSMGKVERNIVRNVRGIGIFCGDYSHCTIKRNDVRGVQADGKTGSRAGFAVVSHYFAVADVSDTPGPSSAFLNATLDHE
jgi:Right handed beta helix region